MSLVLKIVKHTQRRTADLQNDREKREWREIDRALRMAATKPNTFLEATQHHPKC